MKPELNNDFLSATSLGLEIAVAVFLGAGAGYLADLWLKSAPWGMVAGLVIGAIVGFWNAIKFAEKK
ncbi:MAG TPA: AtpZ/AtpI family protein [Candidatus Sulfotelmatobacter sp.]|nr:AtpZ/AtpI family protein [Candidatus Sulfotelmatobacter sp.]